MSLVTRFLDDIKNNNLFSTADHLFVAVSGGADSAVLCELLHQSGFSFTIVHCNFQLRGKESERDEHFVVELGRKYGMEVLIKKFDTKEYAEEHKCGIQVAARELRYKWFGELVAVSGESKGYVLTAHHADDNIETVLLNFFRGTGVSGLKGMLPSHDQIVRPLLQIRKEEILNFASENHLSWVEDSSNISDKYTRNFFRHRVIPLVKEKYLHAEENVLNNIGRFSEAAVLYHQAIAAHKKKLLFQKNEEIHIPVLKLKLTNPLRTILYEIIRDFNFSASQVDEVIGLLESETGKYISSSSHRIIKNRKWLIISPLSIGGSGHFIIEENDHIIHFASGHINIEKVEGHPFHIDKSPSVALLEARKIKYPLLLRKWKKGDYFYPLGMQKKKKLSRFFIDQKLSLIQKENTWVIEMKGKILWVVGLRIDDRFKITSSTGEALRLTVKPGQLLK